MLITNENGHLFIFIGSCEFPFGNYLYMFLLISVCIFVISLCYRSVIFLMTVLFSLSVPLFMVSWWTVILNFNRLVSVSHSQTPILNMFNFIVFFSFWYLVSCLNSQSTWNWLLFVTEYDNFIDNDFRFHNATNL